MIWKVSQNCLPPHLFLFFLLPLLSIFLVKLWLQSALQNRLVCVQEQKKDLAEKHRRAYSKWVSSGGGGSRRGWTPTPDIPCKQNTFWPTGSYNFPSNIQTNKKNNRFVCSQEFKYCPIWVERFKRKKESNLLLETSIQM